ncbi:MAG: hypothetical protein EXR50_03010 [Dehalococcoidia bacterium]|nr:hypothetical protein [Dehalococcoidia bacterium]
MARLPDVTWDNLTLEQQQALWPSRRMVGPYRVLMNIPRIGEAHFRLSQTLRESQNLPAELRKLAILATAREQNCQFVWSSHEVSAHNAGARPEAVDAIRSGLSLATLFDDEALVISYTQELIRSKRVTDTTFQTALSRFGELGLLELTSTVGYYLMMCAVNNAFEVRPEDDGLPRLLPE